MAQVEPLPLVSGDMNEAEVVMGIASEFSEFEVLVRPSWFRTIRRL